MENVVITTIPVNPTTDDAIVLEFRFSIESPVLSRTIDGNSFVLRAEAATDFGFSTPQIESWAVGRLEPGQYEAVLVTTIFGELEQIGAVSFDVAEGVLPLAIPDLGLPALMVLAAALAWIAKLKHPRSNKSGR